MLAPSARLRGRAVRWARRRPVRSLSATIDTFAFGSVQPRCSGATTIDPPALSATCRSRVRTGKSRPLPSSSSRRRAAEPVPSAATTTRKPRPISSVRRSVSPVPSPATGPQPDASTSGVSGDSGVESIDQNAPDCRRAACRDRRGGGGTAVGIAGPRRRQRAGEVVLLGDEIDRPVAHPARFDEQRAWPPSGSTSVSSRSSLDRSQGSQLSMPSKCAPSDSRSHCSRPHGSVSTSLAARGAHVVGRHQLAGREDAHLGDVADRALVVHAERGQPVDLVAPQVDADRGVGGRRDTRR